MAVDLEPIFERAEEANLTHVLLIGISHDNSSFHILGDEEMLAPIALTLLAVAQKLVVEDLANMDTGVLN